MGRTHFSGPLTVAGVEIVDSSGNLVAPVEISNLEEIIDSNGNELLEFSVTASAVNHLAVTNAATGNSPSLAATGGDANVDVVLIPKGSGNIVVGSPAAAATLESNGNFDLVLQTGNATTGTITITDGANGDITVAPNGTGNLVMGGARGIESSVSNAIVPFVLATASEDIAAGTGGAINVTSFYTSISTDAGGDAFTLADGAVIGQLKKIKLIVDGGGDGTLTPTNLSGGTTITFADAGDYALLLWNGTDWVAIELGNDADGATAPVLA